MENYSQLVEKIAEISKLEKEEIERRVEAKRAKLSGLVSKEGAAQIVAAELGINFDKERLKISQLVQGMKRANIVGKVTQLYPIRSYNKNGREGKVGNFNIADESANVKVVLWDVNHIGLIEQGKIKEGTVLEISNGNVRNGEVHLSSFSDIKESNEKIGNVVEKRIFGKIRFKDVKPGQGLMNRAFIVQTFDPRYYEVCPECGKKIIDNECKVHGKVEPKHRAILNIVLDDGTDILRAVLFGEQINKLGLTNEEIFSLEQFALAKEKLLGEEKIFVGNVKTNALFNNTELSVEDINEVNTDELLKELELISK